MTSPQPDNIHSLLQEFRSEADSKSPSTATAYHQAITLFAAYYGLPYPFLTYLCLNGYTPKTAIHYNNIISSLLKKSSLAGEYPLGNVARPVQTTATLHSPLSTLNLPLSTIHSPLLLTSLLNGALPISRLISLRVSDLPSLTPQTRDLLARIISPKRKYIFPLDQSLLTPKQVREKVENDLRATLRSNKIPIVGNVDETLRSIWAITALRLGHSPAEILSVIPHVPLGTPWMPDERCENPEVTDTSLLIEEVGGALFNNPEEWFAMRLRPKVTFSQLTDRLSTLNSQPSTPTAPLLFYPYEEIARRTGKKIEFQHKPVIRDIVFFRSRITDILPLFAKIGDLAWCYKSDGPTGRTYAKIPRRSFERFQQTIGQFTPDYEVAPIGTLPLLPGEKVEILSGPLSGRQATIEFLETTTPAPSQLPSPPSTLYRLLLIGDNGIEWRIRLPQEALKVSH